MPIKVFHKRTKNIASEKTVRNCHTNLRNDMEAEVGTEDDSGEDFMWDSNEIKSWNDEFGEVGGRHGGENVGSRGSNDGVRRYADDITVGHFLVLLGCLENSFL